MKLTFDCQLTFSESQFFIQPDNSLELEFVFNIKDSKEINSLNHVLTKSNTGLKLSIADGHVFLIIDNFSIFNNYISRIAEQNDCKDYVEQVNSSSHLLREKYLGYLEILNLITKIN